MAKFQGVKEKLHSPVFDAFVVPAPRNGEPPKTFQAAMTDPRVIRFFVDVQNKTKLETNMQAAGVLPSLNTFEARAMRVVTSAFCLPERGLAIISKDILEAANAYRNAAPFSKGKEQKPNEPDGPPPQASATEGIRLVNTILAAFAAAIGAPMVNGHMHREILLAADSYRIAPPFSVTGDRDPPDGTATGAVLKRILDAFVIGCEAASAILPELIYNSVTTLIVGEKVMIEMPTFWFPAGAGVSPGNGNVTNHGEPDPMATFRFAEPIFIEPQQNFRVEMLFPQGLPKVLQDVTGPLRIWVMLDGYLTRDVQ